MIELIPVELNDYVKESYILGLEFHYDYGLKIGIDDKYVKSIRTFDFEKELNGDEVFYEIYSENQRVGILVTSIDNEHIEIWPSAIELKMIFIDSDHRRKKYGLEAILKLKEMVHMPIIISCYYNIEANVLYEKIATKFLSKYYL